jgi:hypothetical protein
LFSFDDAPVTAPAQTSNNTFDAFSSTTAPTPVANDDFGDFQEIAPMAPVQFDAFGASAAAPTQEKGGFDAFGGSITADTIQQTQGMVGNQQMGAEMNSMNTAFGNINVQSQQIPTITAPTNNDDDFGDFADAEPSATKSTLKASDPLSSLISLDGLTKNVKKEKKISEPVDDKQTNLQMGMPNNLMGFQGIGNQGNQSSK